MILNKSGSEFKTESASQSVERMAYVKSKTVQLKEIVNEPFPLRAHGKAYTIGGVKIPPTDLYYTIDKPLKQVREQNRTSTENIKQQNTTRQHNDNGNRKTTLDTQNSMNTVGKMQTIHVPNPSVQNIKVITLREQQNNAENSNRYRETQTKRQEYTEKNAKGLTRGTFWKEEMEKEKNEKENDASDDSIEKQEEEDEDEDEDEEDEKEEEEEEEEEEEKDDENDEEEDEKYGRLLHIPRRYKQNKMPDTYSKNKNLLFAATKKTHQEADAENKIKNSIENNERKQSKEKYNHAIQKKQSKSVSIQIDAENWINSTTQYSSFSSISSYKKTKSNEKTIQQVIRSKLRKVRIILKFLYICKKNTYNILSTGRPPTSANKKKNSFNKVVRIQGPFLLKKESEKQTIRKPGYIPNNFKKFLKNSSAQNKTINNNKRIVLEKDLNTKVYQLFQNMLAIDTLGRLQRWDGYNWNPIHAPFYHFTSVYTNNKGHLLCVDQNYNPGYLMENKYFKKVEAWQDNHLAQIVFDQNNKIWGLHLSGDLLKWNKYNWMKISRAYGISKIKFIAIDRKNHLWLLDSNNYLFSYDTINKSWSQENVNGNNIKYFDFDENNYLVAVTEDALIKIYKRKKWIQYGILGQLKICGVHFIRQMDSASSIVKTKNEKKINVHQNKAQN